MRSERAARARPRTRRACSGGRARWRRSARHRVSHLAARGAPLGRRARGRVRDRRRLATPTAPQSSTSADRSRTASSTNSSDAIARGLAARGVRAGDRVGVLCRNHRLLLRDHRRARQGRRRRAVPQHRLRGAAAARRDGARARHAARARRRVRRARRATAGIEPTLLAWTDARPSGTPTRSTSSSARSRGRAATDAPDARVAHDHPHVGDDRAARRAPRASNAAARPPRSALLERIPYRAGETMVVAAPCFHSWGFANAIVGLAARRHARARTPLRSRARRSRRSPGTAPRCSPRSR